jgi:hypothetical protein
MGQREGVETAERKHLTSIVLTRKPRVKTATQYCDYSWGNGLFSAGTIGARSF